MTNKYFIISRQKIYCLCLVIITALFLQSCVGTEKHRSGKLSDAMEEASDEHKGERKVNTQPDPDDEDEDDDIDYSVGVGSHSSSLVANDSLTADSALIDVESDLNWFTLSGGTGLLKKDDFFGLNHASLALGAYAAQRHYFEVYVGISWAPVQETSMLSESLDGGVTLLQIGGGYKFYTTPRHTFLGLYLCAGLGYAYMRWSYKNPFEAMAYDENGNELGMETISGDGVSGFEMFAGLGINLIQSKNFQLGAEVLPGLITWGGETSEGFNNDIFDTFYYTKLKLSLRFGW